MDPCLNSADLTATLSRVFGSGPAGIIFDCDGVLVDSLDANTHYYNLIRAGVGLPPVSDAQARRAHMTTTQEAIQSIIPPSLLPAAREVAQTLSYERDIQPLVRPMPGMEETLRSCREQGLRLAVDTNRGDSMQTLLDQLELNGLFDPVVTILDVPIPKPNPAGALNILQSWGLPPQRVLFVGDSSVDHLAADAAGIPFLAFGGEEPSELGCCAAFPEFLGALRTLWSLQAT